MRILRTLAAAMIATVAITGAVQAEEFEIKMLNKGEDGLMVFEPGLVQIQQGDTVHFVATDPGHNAETVNNLLPEGAEPFKGAMGKELTVTFDVGGAYVIKCLPHFAMGMVALVIVGEDPANLTDIENAGMPRKAQERIDAEIAKL